MTLFHEWLTEFEYQNASTLGDAYSALLNRTIRGPYSQPQFGGVTVSVDDSNGVLRQTELEICGVRGLVKGSEKWQILTMTMGTEDLPSQTVLTDAALQERKSTEQQVRRDLLRHAAKNHHFPEFEDERSIHIQWIDNGPMMQCIGRLTCFKHPTSQMRAIVKNRGFSAMYGGMSLSKFDSKFGTHDFISKLIGSCGVPAKYLTEYPAKLGSSPNPKFIDYVDSFTAAAAKTSGPSLQAWSAYYDKMKELAKDAPLFTATQKPLFKNTPFPMPKISLSLDGDYDAFDAELLKGMPPLITHDTLSFDKEFDALDPAELEAVLNSPGADIVKVDSISWGGPDSSSGKSSMVLQMAKKLNIELKVLKKSSLDSLPIMFKLDGTPIPVEVPMEKGWPDESLLSAPPPKPKRQPAKAANFGDFKLYPHAEFKFDTKAHPHMEVCPPPHKPIECPACEYEKCFVIGTSKKDEDK